MTDQTTAATPADETIEVPETAEQSTQTEDTSQVPTTVEELLAALAEGTVENDTIRQIVEDQQRDLKEATELAEVRKRRMESLTQSANNANSALDDSYTSHNRTRNRNTVTLKVGLVLGWLMNSEELTGDPNAYLYSDDVAFYNGRGTYHLRFTYNENTQVDTPSLRVKREGRKPRVLKLDNAGLTVSNVLELIGYLGLDPEHLDKRTAAEVFEEEPGKTEPVSTGNAEFDEILRQHAEECDNPDCVGKNQEVLDRLLGLLALFGASRATMLDLMVKPEVYGGLFV